MTYQTLNVSPELLKERQILDIRLSVLDDIISDKIESILETIHTVYGSKFDSWYVDGAEEGELGDLSELGLDDEFLNFECITFYANPHLKKAMIIIDGKELDLLCQAPSSWLFYDESYIVSEIKTGKALYEKKLITKKQKVSAKKETDKSLIKSIKSKLTPEELVYLEKKLLKP